MVRSKLRSFTVGHVASELDAIAPPFLAQSWDNVGLLVGDRGALCRRVLLCIDLTLPVLNEGIGAKCDLVVAYHPPIFRPIKRLVADSNNPVVDDMDAIVHRAIAHGMAIYSPHTALDAAAGGTNDVMADLCGLTDVGPFEYVSPSPHQSKIVTFVPHAQLEKVAQAMFAAGAGRIGDYEQCSYRSAGEGTFFGTDSTHPQLGEKGRLEHVAETRLEMVAPNSRLAGIIEALRKNHPYEEAAFDVYPLATEPVAGIGRIGQLPAGLTLGRLARKLERATRSKNVSLVGSGATRICLAAVCVGAAGRLPLEMERALDCDVIVTGEIRHHEALTILRAGKSAIALGHWESERPALVPLAEKITGRLSTLKATISQADTSPFSGL